MSLKKRLIRIIIRLLKLLNYILTGLSLRITKWTGKSSFNIHPKHLLKKEPEYLKYFDEGDKVLDIGCDNGSRSLKLAEKVRTVVAFDYNEKALKKAQKASGEKGVSNVSFLKLSAEERLPFSDNEFDKILFLDVIEHLYERTLILKEALRILREGGKMVITVPNIDTKWKRRQKSVGLNCYSDPDHKHEYYKEEIVQELKLAGFQVELIEPIVYDLPVPGIIDFIGAFDLKRYEKLANWKRERAFKKPENSIGFFIVVQK